MIKRIQFFCPRWGSEALSWEDFIIRAKGEGYDGIEFGISSDTSKQQLEQISAIALNHNMLLIAQQYDTYEEDFEKHKKLFAAWFEKIELLKPVFVNSQTGKDFFSPGENAALFKIAAAYTNKTGIQVYHETHRNKCLFAAHIARRYFEMFPQLQITLDMSHWVCVAESLLHDQKEVMEIACNHTAHIHARVGYAEGPQVTDPFLPQWKNELDTHLFWWDTIIQKKMNDNITVTITPEFGAFPYMVHLPDTNKPISDQWSINVNMMNMLKKRYGIFISADPFPIHRNNNVLEQKIENFSKNKNPS